MSWPRGIRLSMLWRLQTSILDHYATLGLDRRCTDAQIRAAYRILAKQHHPDLNHGSEEGKRLTQAINAAYKILSDPKSRENYDRDLAAAEPARSKGSLSARNISQDLLLPLEEFFRGARREMRVNDPGNPGGPELTI